MQLTFTKTLSFLFILGMTFTLNAQAPMNNECGGAMDVSSLFGQMPGMSQTSGLMDNTNATTEASDPATGWECFGEPDGGGATPSLENTLWYSFVGDGGLYYITTTQCTSTNYLAAGDTQIAIYSGACDGLTAAACNEDGPDATQTEYPAGLDFQTEDGVTYYMLIDGFAFNGAESRGEFCIQVTQQEPVAVIECIEGNSGTVTGTAFVCNGESTVFTLADVVVPTVGTAGFFWVVSSADISGSMDPNAEESYLGAFGVTAEPYEPALLNDGTQLPAGLYYFTPVAFGDAVADATGALDFTNACVFTSNSVEVNLVDELEPLDATINSSDLSGPGSFITVEVFGGSGSYTYLWNTGDTTAVISDLEQSGSYECIISDVTGCTDDLIILVNLLEPVNTNDLALGAAVSITPNPTNDFAQISFDLNEATNLNINVMNVLGRVIFTENHSNTTAGTSTVDVSSWSNGVYFVQFSNGSRQYTQRLIVQK